MLEKMYLKDYYYQEALCIYSQGKIAFKFAFILRAFLLTA